MEHYIQKPIIRDKTIPYKNKFPDGLQKYCDLFINDNKTIIDLQKLCSKGGIYYKSNIDMRYTYFQLLIHKFLDTKFVDKSIYSSIRDMPQEEQLLAIECLGHSIGMNPHNGNTHLLEIVERFNIV